MSLLTCRLIFSKLTLFIPELNRSKVFLDETLVIVNDGIHEANARLCINQHLRAGVHKVYVIGFAAYLDSELEVTYSGPDTYGVRTVMGGQPFFYACDPRAPVSAAAAFTLCTFKSDPTSSWNGDCTPTVGIAHPRYPGPCAKAIGTDSLNFDVYSGGFYVPVLGSSNGVWVCHAFILGNRSSCNNNGILRRVTCIMWARLSLTRHGLDRQMDRVSLKSWFRALLTVEHYLLVTV